MTAWRNTSIPRWISWVLVAAMGLVAVAVHLNITAHGAGVSPDSTRYLGAASNFAAGRGMVHLGDDGDLIPLELWPPGFPFLLSLGTSSVDEAWAWGRILNALLFGANAVVVYLMIRRCVGGRWAPALVGALLFLVSPDIVEIHTWIWSEPVTILTGSLGLLFTDKFLETRRPTYLVLGALIAGFSVLTRFAAAAYVAAGAVGLLTLGSGIPRSRRFSYLLIYLGLGLLPILLWVGRDGGLGGDSLSRAIEVNERGLAQLGTGIFIVSDWFLPGRVPEPARSSMTRLILAAWLVLVVWSLAARRSARRRGEALPATYLPELLALFVAFYASVLVVVRMLVSPGVSISPRIFSLGLAALISLTVSAVTFASDRFMAWRRSRSPRQPALEGPVLVFLLVSLAAAIGALNASHSADFARRVHSKGLGYAAIAWRESPVIRYLGNLPPDASIITNGPDAVYFLTGRMPKMLPAWPYDSAEGGAILPDSLAVIEERVHPGDVLVYFRGISWRGSMNERQIKQAFALSALIGDTGASAFRVEGLSLPSSGEPGATQPASQGQAPITPPQVPPAVEMGERTVPGRPEHG